MSDFLRPGFSSVEWCFGDIKASGVSQVLTWSTQHIVNSLINIISMVFMIHLWFRGVTQLAQGYPANSEESVDAKPGSSDTKFSILPFTLYCLVVRCCLRHGHNRWVVKCFSSFFHLELISKKHDLGGRKAPVMILPMYQRCTWIRDHIKYL